MLVGVSIIFHLNKKERGYLHSTVGYINLEAVNPDITSSLYLYLDKITINDVQIIPIERVLKASSYEASKAFNRTTVKRYMYYLTIDSTDKEGKIKSIRCHSKINQRGVYMSHQLPIQINLMSYKKRMYKKGEITKVRSIWVYNFKKPRDFLLVS